MNHFLGVVTPSSRVTIDVRFHHLVTITEVFDDILLDTITIKAHDILMMTLRLLVEDLRSVSATTMKNPLGVSLVSKEIACLDLCLMRHYIGNKLNGISE